MQRPVPSANFTRAGLFVCAASICAFGIVACGRNVGEKEKAPPKKEGVAWFEDVSEALDLNFVHDPGPTGTYFMPQSMGSGAAFLDFDNDGRLDIFLIHQGGPKGKKNQLFHQQLGGKFKDVSSGSGLDVAGYCTGIAIGDIDNDGLVDVVVTEFNAVRVFRNLGAGKFAEITKESGLSNPLWGMSASFLDFDRDGWLDLVIVNYLDYDGDVACTNPKGEPDFCGPNQFRGRSSKLFRNLGGGKAQFEDVSFQSGLGRVVGPGLGVLCADLNGDGWTDIFVANDGKPNRLWTNKKDGTFADEAISRGVAFTSMGNAFAGMGVAMGDVDGDLRADLFVTHLGTESHTLWRQDLPGQFRDDTAKSGLLGMAWRGTGFGTLMADFDLNGSLDIVVVNGRVIRGGPCPDTNLGFWQTYAERNQIFANDGKGTFRDYSEANPAFSGHWNVGRGIACGDFDNDGAPDLLVSSIGGRARLFRNVSPNRGAWLHVVPIDPKLKRTAIGAEVRVLAGGKSYLRVVSPQESYLSSSSATAMFGLANAQNVESIEIRWPDGTAERFPGGGVNRKIELRRGDGAQP